MNQYFSGQKLWGDDFTPAEMEAWYHDEKEGYAGLENTGEAQTEYGFHHLNHFHGFRFLKKIARFGHVLGIGAAFGVEFKPILPRIERLTILEPSDQLTIEKLEHLQPEYVKPAASGEMPFPENSFDLVTSFGTLHHIPNVSFVMKEVHRCLKPGGHFLLREPVISMGDWRLPRPGLTKRERGIPLEIFRKIIADLGFEIIHEGPCMTAGPFLERNIGKFLPKPLKAYLAYVWFDAVFGKLTAWNLHYHASRFWQRIAPVSIFYVLKK